VHAKNYIGTHDVVIDHDAYIQFLEQGMVLKIMNAHCGRNNYVIANQRID
jgi:hypothetical protein